MSSVDFYFILGVDKIGGKKINIKNVKILDESENEVPIENTFNNNKEALYNYKITLLQENEDIELNLSLKYENNNFTLKTLIFKNINKNHKAIFYYENIEFASSWLSSSLSFFKTSDSPKDKLLTYSKKDLFYQYHIQFKNDKKYEDIFDIFLEQSFKELLDLDKDKDLIDIKTFEKTLYDEFIINYDYYKRKSFKNLMKELIGRIVRKKSFEDLDSLIKIFTKTNKDESHKEKHIEIQNIIFKEIYLTNNFKFISDNLEMIFYFYDFIQFHEEWFAKIFIQTNWENFHNNYANKIDCKYYQEIILN